MQPRPHANSSNMVKGSMLLTAALAGLPAQAQEFSVSGFGTLALGQTSGACETNAAMASAFNGPCTRAIADWGHGGVYTTSLSGKPESRLGVQGQARLSSDWSATVQITSRALDEQHLNLEWAYLSYKINPD